MNETINTRSGMMTESRLSKEIGLLDSMRASIDQRQKQLEQEFISDHKMIDVGAEFVFQHEDWKVMSIEVCHMVSGRAEVVYRCARKLKNGNFSVHEERLTNDHFRLGYAQR